MSKLTQKAKTNLLLQIVGGLWLRAGRGRLRRPAPQSLLQVQWQTLHG